MTKRILLCDDEIHILKAAQIKFTRAGFEVRCASDGEEAWETLQDWLPDVVISDCQMPRLDGIGLITRMRSDPRTVDLPVMLLTAKGLELSSAEMRSRLNVEAVLGKPFSPRDLLRRVESILAPSEPVS